MSAPNIEEAPPAEAMEADSDEGSEEESSGEEMEEEEVWLPVLPAACTAHTASARALATSACVARAVPVARSPHTARAGGPHPHGG